MAVGDLVVVICQSRNDTTWSIGVDGGQTWTAEAPYTDASGNCRSRWFWCAFDGTWDADPRFDSVDSSSTSAIMLVFRPIGANPVWVQDVAFSGVSYVQPSTPFTVTIPGVTTTGPDTVTLASWGSIDDNTWGTLAGTGWSKAGLAAQYRNTSGSDQSLTFAYHLDASGATIPNVSQNQLTLGGDRGAIGIMAWRAITGGQAYTKSIADGLSLSEMKSSVAAFIRSLPPDVVTLSEARTTTAAFARLLVDAMPIIEAFDAAMPHVGSAILSEANGFLTLEEGHRLTLEFVGGLALTKNVADGLTLNDIRTSAAGFVRSTGEPISLSEAFARIVAFARSQTDPTALAEALIRISTWRRSFADSLAMGENIAKSLALVRSYADAIAMADTLAKQMQLARSFADAMTLGEAITKALILTRSISDPLTLGETLLRNALFARLQTEAIALGEAFAKVGGFARSFQDPLVFGELTRRTFGRPVADLINLGESLTKLVVLVRSFADSLTLGDAVAKFVLLGRAMSDSITLGETITRVFAFARSYGDAITLMEVFARTVGFNRSTLDPIVLVELLSKAVGFNRSIPDPITLVDVIDVLKIGPAFRSAWARRHYNLGMGVPS
jgi:hypothetical protein